MLKKSSGLSLSLSREASAERFVLKMSGIYLTLPA